MSSQRKVVFQNDFVYHVFNRGIDRRPVFLKRGDYLRAQQLIAVYKHAEIPIRFSQIYLQPENIRIQMLKGVYKSERIVDVLSYCFMPNHFHFILLQKQDGGISRFMSNFTNAYTRYFNTKYKRLGHLFEGVFKGVFVESDEQLIHLSRYIHLNPISASIIEIKKIQNYQWSSYMNYLSSEENLIVETDFILGLFNSREKYRQFVLDQAEYAKELKQIEHLIIE